MFVAFSAMLATLRIRNFALVESLSWEVPAGFIAITGETGAGKSILIGGLKLLLGERAEKSAIRAGGAECVIEAAIDVDATSPVHALLEAAGVEPCEEGQLLLKRVIPATAAGRQFVNGSPCTLSLLREVGDRLVDLHGPHDHQSLFSRDAQVRVLDAFAGSRANFLTYTNARRAWLALQAEQAASAADELAIRREIDLLEHQTTEIEDAQLKPGEEAPLAASHQTAAHAQRLQELSAAAAHQLADAENSVEDLFLEISRSLREVARLDPAAQNFTDRGTALAGEITDLARALRAYGDGIDADPATLARIETRLDVIEGLKRKYGPSLADVIAFGEDATSRLAALRARTERRATLDTTIADAEKAVHKAGVALSAQRRKAAPKLAAEVRRHLKDLGFLKAGFEIQLTPGEPAPEGLESVEFVFAPNPGEPAQPLRAIASSGEISRVMLALKTSLASQDEVPILVFDEIDANVGGEVAHAVAAKMREISARRQVLCITHLPQVAARAGAHFVVSKSVVEGRTISTLDAVTGDDRATEVARMLGSRQGAAALAHAHELLAP